ncbi:tyrosine-protein kinase receptor UFO-like [Halichondria panicea]|uniref:tyrosine-protein kinase receptor UFO-like n=1 Tax=Halichondria panicea TaxID=6063 RepID=UPI00312B5736
MSFFVLLTVFIAVVAANECDKNAFVTNPLSMEARLGDFVNFTCDISTDTFLHRTFRHYMINGVPRDFNTFSDGNDMYYRRAIGGNGSVVNTLLIEGVQPYHAGQYQCFATSDGTNCIRFFSAKATLSIIGEPVIDSPTAEFSGFTLANLSVILTITGTTPTVQVYREGVLIDNPRVKICFANTQFEMIISDLQRSDAGQYRIVATNHFDMAETTITVVPIGPDRPVVDLMDAQVSAYGTAATLTCSIQTEAQEDFVEFFWRDTQNRVITSNNKFSISSDAMSSTLTINSFTSNFTGGYTCVANNSRGTASKLIMLFGPPALVTNILIFGTSSSRQRTVTWQQPGNSMEPIQKHLILIYREGEDVADMRREENSSSLTADGVMYSYYLTDLNPGSFELTVTPISVVGDNTVLGPESARKMFSVGVSNSVIISVIVIVVVAALALLAIVCCVCIRRSKQNKLEMPITSTIRLRKLSDRSTLMDYQMGEIVKNVPESMRIPRSNLKLQDAVGQGAFGIVYKGLLMDWNNVAIRVVALKTLKGLFTPNDVQSMVREITKMQEFHHPHVMPLIGACLDAGSGISMVMPYMTNGSLLNYLKKERCNLDLTEREDSDEVFSVRKLLLKMCHQIALGMAYLAQHKFVHRDLASRNCMLDSNGDLKVGDFGLAEDVYSTGYFRQIDSERVKLPYKWLALESLNDAIFNEKTDVWSYGVTMWEVFSGGRTPYPGVDPMSLVALLREGRRLEPPQNTACSTEMVSLMARCWYEKSEERPSFDELAAELERALTIMVGYVELNMELKVAIPEEELKYDYVLSPEGQMNLAKASTDEVAMDTNGAYGLRVIDQLPTEEVELVETIVTYEIRKDLELNMELVSITEDEPMQ